MDSDDNTNDNINDTNDNNYTDNYGILNNFELVWILLNYLMGTNIYFNLILKYTCCWIKISKIKRIYRTHINILL